MKPKISVIIPCYNYGKFLSESLDSLLAQSCQSWETIIIDYGSTDNTRLIADNYIKKDSRFKYIRQENKGVSNARNRGLIQAEGEYIQLLDADDLLSTDKLELQLQFMYHNPKVDISYTRALYFLDNNPEKKYKNIWLNHKEWMPKLDHRGQEIIGVLLRRNLFPINSILFKKKMISQVGFFDENLYSVEDWDYWLRCALRNLHFTFLDHKDACALIRVHPRSLSQQEKQNEYYQILLREKINSTLQQNSYSLSKKQLLKFLQVNAKKYFMLKIKNIPIKEKLKLFIQLNRPNIWLRLFYILKELQRKIN